MVALCGPRPWHTAAVTLLAEACSPPAACPALPAVGSQRFGAVSSADWQPTPSGVRAFVEWAADGLEERPWDSALLQRQTEAWQLLLAKARGGLAGRQAPVAGQLWACLDALRGQPACLIAGRRDPAHPPFNPAAWRACALQEANPLAGFLRSTLSKAEQNQQVGAWASRLLR